VNNNGLWPSAPLSVGNASLVLCEHVYVLHPPLTSVLGYNLRLQFECNNAFIFASMLTGRLCWDSMPTCVQLLSVRIAETLRYQLLLDASHSGSWAQQHVLECSWTLQRCPCCCCECLAVSAWLVSANGALRSEMRCSSLVGAQAMGLA
jgi:hypothetical protein